MNIFEYRVTDALGEADLYVICNHELRSGQPPTCFGAGGPNRLPTGIYGDNIGTIPSLGAQNPRTGGPVKGTSRGGQVGR